MSFQPIVPMGGYAGWRFLERTLETQQTAHAESAPIRRLTDHFRNAIGTVETLDDFMADRQLVQVALGAFGLGDDIGNTAFIRKVLEEGTFEERAFANRLSDRRYAAFSEAMGFGNIGGPGRTHLSGFADEIVSAFETGRFAGAVGAVDNDMRLALNLDTGLQDVLDRHEGVDSRWFAIMGTPPLRAMFETGLGFPPAFGQIDIDQQLDQFKERARQALGSEDPAAFATPEAREELIRLYMIRSEARQIGASQGGSIALTLLRSAPAPYAQLP